MCGRLLANAYPVWVHSRTPAKAKTLLDQGARWAASPRAVAEQATVIFTMVGFPDDVRAVYWAQDGVLAGVQAGSTIVDFSTTEPRLARELYETARRRDVAALDAPVSGGDVGARNGTLSIMVGGDRAALDPVRPLLEVLGSRIVYQGPAGSGQHAKLCNQIVIAGTMIGVCESLLYGFRAGLDLSTLLESIRGGAAGCWTLDHLAPRILRRDFAPGFLVEHFIKDMGLALDEARRMKLALPGLALVQQLYLAVHAHGHGRSGTQALLLALEQLSSVSMS